MSHDSENRLTACFAIDPDDEATELSFVIESKRFWVTSGIGEVDVFLPFSIRLVFDEVGFIFFGSEVTISGTLNIGISVDVLVDISV